MVLANQPTYPQSRAYVLKLHCEAAPAAGEIRGLIENVATGRRVAFANAQELIATLVSDALASTSTSQP